MTLTLTLEKFILEYPDLKKIGDIIVSVTGIIIEIDDIKPSLWTRYPEPLYIGKELTKKLVPRKDGLRNSISHHGIRRCFEKRN